VGYQAGAGDFAAVGIYVGVGAGTSGVTGGQVFDNVRVEVTGKAGSTVAALEYDNEEGAAILRGVELQTYPAGGTFHDIYVNTGEAGATSAVLYDDATIFGKVTNAAGIPVAPINPHVATLYLTAADGQATPATAAAADSVPDVYLFDDATTEYRSWRDRRVSPLAIAYPRLAPRARVWWKPEAGTGTAVWQLQWCSMAVDDPFGCSPAAGGTLEAATSGVAGDVQTSEWLTLDTLPAGELLLVQLARLGGDGADDLSGDAGLIAVEIEYEVQ